MAHKEDAMMEGFFLFLFACVSAFLLYQGKFNQEKGQDGFFLTQVPEVTWKGSIKEKYRVDDSYTFVMNVDGKFKKLADVSADAYHKNEVGDIVNMIVEKEDVSVNKLAIFVIIVLLVTIWLSDAWLVFCVSFGTFSLAKWLGADDIPVFLLIVINTVLAHGHTIFHEYQRATIRDAVNRYETKEVFLFMSFPDTMNNSKFFKWFGKVYVRNGDIHKSREDAVVSELKG